MEMKLLKTENEYKKSIEHLGKQIAGLNVELGQARETISLKNGEIDKLMRYKK